MLMPMILVAGAMTLVLGMLYAALTTQPGAKQRGRRIDLGSDGGEAGHAAGPASELADLVEREQALGRAARRLLAVGHRELGSSVVHCPPQRAFLIERTD